MNRSTLPSWSWKVMVGMGTIAGVIVSFFSIQQIFDQRLQKEFATQSERIIIEIQDKSNILVDFQKDDLWDRIQLLETEIESRRNANQQIPERMRIHLRSMRERYNEMKDPWKK